MPITATERDLLDQFVDSLQTNDSTPSDLTSVINDAEKLSPALKHQFYTFALTLSPFDFLRYLDKLYAIEKNSSVIRAYKIINDLIFNNQIYLSDEVGVIDTFDHYFKRYKNATPQEVAQEVRARVIALRSKLPCPSKKDMTDLNAVEGDTEWRVILDDLPVRQCLANLPTNSESITLSKRAHKDDICVLPRNIKVVKINGDATSELLLALPEHIQQVRFKTILSEMQTFSLSQVRTLGYILQKDYENASFELAFAFEEDPNHWYTLYLQGRYHDLTDSDDLAFQFYSQAIQLNPAYHTTFYYRGILHFTHGSWNQAISDFTKVLSHYPQHIVTYEYRASAYQHARRIPEAIEDLSRILSMDDANINALISRCNIYLSQNEFTKCMADFSNVISLAQVNRSYIRQRNKLFKKIVAALNKEIERLYLNQDLQGQKFVLLKILANIFLLMEKHTESLATCQKVLNDNPADVEALVLRAKIYDSLNNHILAIQDLDAAILELEFDEDENHASAIEKLKVAKKLYYKNGLSYIKEKLKESPENTAYLKDRAHLYLLMGYYEKGFKPINLYMAKHPISPQASAIRAQLYAGQNKYILAYRDIVEAIQCFPSSEKFIQIKNTILVDAESYFQASLDETPSDLNLLFDRAALCFARGKFESALDDLKEIIKLEPTHIKALTLMGEVFLSMGQPETARMYLALAKKPATPLKPSRKHARDSYQEKEGANKVNRSSLWNTAPQTSIPSVKPAEANTQEGLKKS